MTGNNCKKHYKERSVMKIRYKNTSIECKEGLLARIMNTGELGKIALLNGSFATLDTEPLGVLHTVHVNSLEAVIAPGTYISRNGALGIMLKEGIASAEVLAHDGNGFVSEEWANTSFELADKSLFAPVPEKYITTMIENIACKEREVER